MNSFTEYFDKEKGICLECNLLDRSEEYAYLDPRPAMLVIPGGGYHMCSDREAEPIAMLFALEGYNTFVLRYTVGQTGSFDFDQPFSDAKRALRYIRENAEKLNTDPSRVAAIGFSAGGHLCSALATLSEEKPDAIVLGYPCILENMSDILACHVPATDVAVTSATPPTFIFAAADDTLVPVANSLSFAGACADNGVECEMHIFASGGHGFSLASPSVCHGRMDLECAKWQKLCVTWLNNKFFKDLK